MNTNYNSLLNLKILKSVSDIFMNNFLIFYFFTISDDNILQIGIYYLIVYCMVYFIIYLVRDKCKSKRRILLLRLSVLFNFLFFLALFLFGDNVINYTWVVAIIYGLEEGCYYSVYNNFESTGVKNTERAKFLGTYICINSFISVLVPVIFGFFMNIDGFVFCLVFLFIISLFQMFWSIKFKDKFYKEDGKCDMKSFNNIIENTDIIKKLNIAVFFQGIIYSGAFNSIVVIYIIRTLQNSLEFGIFTGIFALITSISGWFFAKRVKSVDYEKHLKLGCFLTCVCLLLIIIDCNLVTIIIFNLIQAYSKTIIELINETAKIGISNIINIRDKYKIEYFVVMEKIMMYGRVFSYLLFISLAFSNETWWSNLILIIFGLLIILYTVASVNLNRKIVKDGVHEKDID